MAPPDDIYAVDRITSTDGGAVLERLSGTDLVARGCVTLVSVEPIRRRMGERWLKKRADVWAYVNRRMSEQLGPQALRERVSETDFLIALTTVDKPAAHAASLKLVEEVLAYFLGSAEPADLHIRMVTEIRHGQISATAVTREQIQAAEQAAGPLRAADPHAEAARRSAVCLTAADGQPLRVDFALEQVVSLSGGAVLALRVEPVVRQVISGRLIPAREFGRLADEDVGAMDAAALHYAAPFLAQVGPGQPPVIVPASFRTIAARRGRNGLSAIDGVAAAQVRARLILELVDLGRGVPQGRLTEVAGLAGALCRSVYARLPPSREGIAAVGKAGRLQGLTVDGADLAGGDGEVAGQLLSLGDLARGLAPVLIAQGLASDGFFHVAEVAGFTHAALRPARTGLGAAA